MRHAPPIPPLEAIIQAAWPAARTNAGKLPDRLPALVHRQPDLLSRVAAYY